MIEKRYGRIVNIASLSSFVALFEVALQRQQAAVASLTKSLAIEWAGSGFVSCIAPGVFRTDLMRSARWDRARPGIPAAHTDAQVWQIEELAGALCFSPPMPRVFVTGHLLVVDGGFLASGLINSAACFPGNQIWNPSSPLLLARCEDASCSGLFYDRKEFPRILNKIPLVDFSASACTNSPLSQRRCARFNEFSRRAQIDATVGTSGLRQRALQGFDVLRASYLAARKNLDEVRARVHAVSLP